MKKKKDPKIYLEDILEFIEDIESYIKGHTKKSFFDDTKTQDAVIRKIEVIGEIVKRLPGILKELAPSIPWKDISGMRDILAHDYADVDLNETWSVAKIDILKLKRQVLKILKKIKEDGE